ncbi:MAG: hypothetical protein WBC44_05380 [Planctomycetaceae bacterium]
MLTFIMAAAVLLTHGTAAVAQEPWFGFLPQADLSNAATMAYAQAYSFSTGLQDEQTDNDSGDTTVISTASAQLQGATASSSARYDVQPAGSTQVSVAGLCQYGVTSTSNEMAGISASDDTYSVQELQGEGLPAGTTFDLSASVDMTFGDAGGGAIEHTGTYKVYVGGVRKLTVQKTATNFVIIDADGVQITRPLNAGGGDSISNVAVGDNVPLGTEVKVTSETDVGGVTNNVAISSGYWWQVEVLATQNP